MTLKNATTWIPQPMGFGYVTNSGAKVNLTTDKIINTGAALTTDKIINTGATLTTGTISVVGKYATIWANTGS